MVEGSTSNNGAESHQSIVAEEDVMGDESENEDVTSNDTENEVKRSNQGGV